VSASDCDDSTELWGLITNLHGHQQLHDVNDVILS